MSESEIVEPTHILIGNYRLEKTIGQGTYGKVKLGFSTQDGTKYAVKVIEKSQIQSSKQVSRLQREIRFLKLLHHPHIVKVHDVIETSECIYIVMEHAAGGELFDYIVAHKRVKENEARSFFRMVLSAVDYCHKNSVIHRDLKPENLLLDEFKCIKIIDFGFGNNFTTDGLLDTFCGSPFYAAPEMILGKKYEGPEVDVWSLGVILFALLCGHLPFDDDDIKKLYKNISSGNYKSPDYLMPDAKHLISRLITVDPKKRATLKEVLEHPWVNEGYSTPPPNYLPEREHITNPALLSKEIVNRLLAFGYKMDEINKSFQSDGNEDEPNPIKSTYFLLSEMFQREEQRLRNEKKKKEKTSISATKSSPTKYIHSASSNSLSMLGSIEENAASSSSKKPQLGNAKSENAFEDTDDIEANENDYHAISKEKNHSSENSLFLAAAHRRASSPHPQVALGGNGLRQGTYQNNVNSTETLRSLSGSPKPRRTLYEEAASSSSTNSGSQGSSSVATPLGTNRVSRMPIGINHSTKPSLEEFAPPPPSNTRPKPQFTSPMLQSIQQELSAPAPTNEPQPPISVAQEAGKRRQSMPISAIPPLTNRHGSIVKIKEEFRAVSGWFMNISTTSTKPPSLILSEITRTLDECGCKYMIENDCIVYIEAEVSSVLMNSPTSQASQTEIDSVSNSSVNSSVESAQSANKKVAAAMNLVAFQIEIVKVPKLTVHGLHFKRLGGGVWNYKKVCNRLLGMMNL